MNDRDALIALFAGLSMCGQRANERDRTSLSVAITAITDAIVLMEELEARGCLKEQKS